MSEYLQNIGDANQQLADTEAKLSDSRAQEAALVKAIRRSKAASGYHTLARLFRKPRETYDLWPAGILAISTVFFACAGFLLMNSFTSIVSISALGALVFAAVGGGSAAALLYYPDDAALADNIPAIERRLELQRKTLEQLRSDIQLLKERQASLKRKLVEFIASMRFRREQLLLQNWKAMRDLEWEHYLAEVFEALGAEVETTKLIGDQGVDLIVKFNSRRIAVQAKGYHHAVSNAAVQQVVAGMRLYRCSGSAVITNSRFTESAKVLAQSNDCRLIGEEEFPEFVRGNIPL